MELNPVAKQGDLIAAIEPVADRLLKTFQAAQARLAGAHDRKDEAAVQHARDEIEALILFRNDLSAYVRLYTFLSQILDYGATALEKRFLFYRRLIPLLEFGREREGVDLSKVVLTHHTLKDEGKRNLSLGGADAPKLPPLAGAGSGAVQDKLKARLAEIIERLNDLFGGDTTDGDKLVYVNEVLKGKLLESPELRLQALSNSKAQFATSPTLAAELMNAIIDAFTAHSSMSKQALESDRVRAGIRDILLGPGNLYEALQSHEPS